MSDTGIDYGLGRTNIDIKLGIRYGVIPFNDLHEWAYDAFEGVYGDPTCPNCESTVIDSPHGKDYFCEKCFESDLGDLTSNDAGTEDDIDHDIYCYWSDEVCPEQALGWCLDDGKYLAEHGEDGDVFIIKSPYFTYAQFCSPCAPGACYLRNTVDSSNDNNMCYCFGHEFFEGEKAPYSVYSVETGELVE